jgi:hypothetical protein
LLKIIFSIRLAKKFKLANKKVDIVFHGDAINPYPKQESVDFIFLRFLNYQIISTQYAFKIFNTVCSTCKIGGYIILLGITPIILPREWFEFVGLQVTQTTVTNQLAKISPYYILKKTNPTIKVDLDKLGLLEQTISGELRHIANFFHCNQFDF